MLCYILCCLGCCSGLLKPVVKCGVEPKRSAAESWGREGVHPATWFSGASAPE
jgi:hypothetical protein